MYRSITKQILNQSTIENRPQWLLLVWLSISYINGKKVSPNPRGTKNAECLSDIRVLSIQIYVLSLSCLAMGINLVQDKEPRD